MVTDVTALVQAEAESRRRADAMGVMLDSQHHGVMLWSADRRLIASNPMASRMYDLPPDLLVPGRPETEMIDAMLRAGHFGSGADAVATAGALKTCDHSVPLERTATTRSGRVLCIESTPAPGGGWVTTLVDITRTREVEAELRKAKEAAEAASSAKSRFLATMSHELRTPLNTIIGFSDALVRKSSTRLSPAEARDYGEQINLAGKQLLGLINTILDVARIETGRFVPGEEVLDVVNLLRTAMRDANGAALVAEVALQLKAPDDLPPLRADERRLLQVLSQLLSNAIKFTEAGGSVTLEARLNNEGSLRIAVIDTGIGIPETDLERVFEPFTQLDDRLSRRYAGAGLGLYSARAIVMAQGGQIRLTGRPGGGTCAEITLPGDRVVA